MALETCRIFFGQIQIYNWKEYDEAYLKFRSNRTHHSEFFGFWIVQLRHFQIGKETNRINTPFSIFIKTFIFYFSIQLKRINCNHLMTRNELLFIRPGNGI